MDRKIAGLIGAVAACAALDAASAAPTQGAGSDPLRAPSYDSLLDPVPNALEALKADDSARAQGARDEDAQLVQFYVRRGHHHHHHGYFRRGERPFFRRYHHHHHHHHHHRFDRY